MTDTPIAAPSPESATPIAPAAPAPRSDAEASEQELQAQPAAPEAPAPDTKKDDAEKEKERQRNRTRDYIQRLNREAAELREENARLKQSKTETPTPARPGTPPPLRPGEPKLEDFDFDYPAWQRAQSEWAVEQALNKRDETHRQTEETAKRRESVAAYTARSVEFAEEHPDFYEVVGAMDLRLLVPELQIAVMGQENGPEIAYHLATNEDELWNLASIRAELMPAAVARLASRLSAAPKAPAPDPVSTPLPKPPPPVSKAPAPAPTVTGRAPTDTPSEKMTDDEWFKRERERTRKR